MKLSKDIKERIWKAVKKDRAKYEYDKNLSLIHISEPTRPY